MKTGVVIWYDHNLNCGAIKAFSGHVYAFIGNVKPGRRVIFKPVNNQGDLLAFNVKEDV